MPTNFELKRLKWLKPIKLDIAKNLALRCRARAGFSRRSRENHTMCGLGPASRVNKNPENRVHELHCYVQILTFPRVPRAHTTFTCHARAHDPNTGKIRDSKAELSSLEVSVLKNSPISRPHSLALIQGASPLCGDAPSLVRQNAVILTVILRVRLSSPTRKPRRTTDFFLYLGHRTVVLVVESEVMEVQVVYLY